MRGLAFDIQHIRSALGSVEDRLAAAKVGVGATRDDDDDGRRVRFARGWKRRGGGVRQESRAEGTSKIADRP